MSVCVAHKSSFLSGSKGPFVFAANVNRGIRERAEGDVILLNDDAVLLTRNGFDLLAEEGRAEVEYGIVSASVYGFVGNPEQKYRGVNVQGFRQALRKTVAFVCVYIRREIINEIGLLDERMVDYGFEDALYCLRLRKAGYKLGVSGRCVVEHGTLPSTFRPKGPGPANVPDNRKVFERIVKEEGLEPWV